MNRKGSQNTGTGLLALESGREDNGPDNTAFGYRTLGNNNGSRNRAIGWNALVIMFRGTDNIALGQTNGHGKRSDLRTQTGYLPLQKRIGFEGHQPVWTGG